MECTSEPTAQSSTELDDAPAFPFCFQCGYDLTGLSLPHPCPECGRLADPEVDAAAARKWFARKSSMLTWLIRPRSIPGGLWCALSDAESARIGRRRVFQWLWLPAILTAFTVGVGHFITVEFDVRIRHKQSGALNWSDWAVHETDSDRLFAFNLHLFRGSMSFGNMTWVAHAVRQRTGFRMSAPTSFDPLPLVWGGAPLAAVALGYHLPRILYVPRKRRYFGELAQRAATRAARIAWTLMCAPLGIALWVWLFSAWVQAVETFSESEESSLVSSGLLSQVAFIWWAIASVIGYGMLARRDHVCLFPRNRLACWVICVTLCLGSPVAFVWILARLA